jgi:hypothetical protein
LVIDLYLGLFREEYIYIFVNTNVIFTRWHYTEGRDVLDTYPSAIAP